MATRAKNGWKAPVVGNYVTLETPRFTSREKIVELQAERARANNATPLSETDVARWRAGEPMTEYAFIGMDHGTVVGRKA